MRFASVEYRESLKPLLAQLEPRTADRGPRTADRKILLLRFFAQMTQSQIADEIGMSQMHLSGLLSRTLARLRAGMSDAG